jgi:para-aminobenzoate synthetase component 1
VSWDSVSWDSVAMSRPARFEVAGWAVVDGRLATSCLDVTDDAHALDSSGFWVVVMTFEGAITCARMAEVRPLAGWYDDAAPWSMPPRSAWASSIGRAGYEAGVRTVRRRIAAGDVYQVNLCRVMSTPMPTPPDLRSLGGALDRGNPAPYAATVDIPQAGLHVACASPELFLARAGDTVSSGPIKGTGRAAADLSDKDAAENVMIVDLVRNDIARVAVPGSVEVPSLLRIEEHPGLVHFVSTVSGTLRPGCGWAELLAAAAPPGSVSGAPKSSALDVIRELEPVPRGVYCGAVGWVDADRKIGRLAVAIRTFVWADGRLHLGTGAGITWGSEPAREWDETELKVSRLLEVR